MTTPTVVNAKTEGPQYATREQYEEIIARLGAFFIEQSGFLKVNQPGGKLYVAATKTVRRVDLSGFEHGLGRLTKTPHCGVFGKVRQQMRVDGTPAEQLARFEELLRHLMTLPAPAPVAKAPKAPKAKAPEAPVADGEAPVAVATPTDPRQDRLDAIARIKELSEKMGKPVSPKLLAEEAGLIAELSLTSQVPEATQPAGLASDEA